jgi:glutamate-5-semialdehyde dehydrogenase
VQLPVVLEAADRAAARRGGRARVHAVGDALDWCGDPDVIEVRRADGTHSEPRVSVGTLPDLAHEFEWEETPEFHVVLVDSVEAATRLFNDHSPQFIVSCVSESVNDHDVVWRGCNAPFVGDGFTRWVDGQFALLRPELGLSNWQTGRLFSRSGILSGDSGYTVRLRVTQSDPDLHR